MLSPLAGIPLEGIPGHPISNSEFRKVSDLDDGSSEYEEVSEEVPHYPEIGFHENLAEHMDEGTLNKIANELIEEIDEDIKTRTEWENAYNKGMKYLGIKVEEFRNYPFANCCSAFDSTLSTALFRSWATCRAEMFPPKGPASYEIFGEATEESELQGEKIKKFINRYLTQIDKDYYPDSERLLLYLILIGCAFRKVFTDPVTSRPLSRFIAPEDFIVNNNCVSILSSNRLTHRLRLEAKELIQRQLSGFYRDIPLPMLSDEMEDQQITRKTIKSIEGTSTYNNNNKKTQQMIYEVHVDRDLEGFEHEDKKSNQTGMPLPYVISILVESKKILSIRRNWAEHDPYYKRKESFVQYGYLPGFGIYSIGVAQLLGSNAIALTSILRQLIDAGTLKNFPGGLKAKGMRVEQNDKAIGPSEFLEIETGGLPIQQCIMTMPYNEPSSVLKDLRNELKLDSQQLASTAETQLADAKPDAPVGTTLALIEVSNKIQSSVLRSMHVSLTNELELIYKLFSEGLDHNVFSVKGQTYEISNMDFNESIRIVPISDPNLTTSTQRILRAEAILRLAQSAPQLHDLRNAYLRMYQAMNVEDIDKLLPPPQNAMPLDPITENMNAMTGKALKAELWQDHQAHIMVHAQFAQENQAIMAHIQEHRAMQYLIDMQMQMGMQMPPMQLLENPEIQNAIAIKSAQVAAQNQQQAQQKQELDPNVVMLKDIEQRREAAYLKNEEAKMRQETEAYKEQMRFELAKKKIDADLEMSEEKNEVDLTIAELKAEESAENTRAKLEAQKSKKE